MPLANFFKRAIRRDGRQPQQSEEVAKVDVVPGTINAKETASIKEVTKVEVKAGIKDEVTAGSTGRSAPMDDEPTIVVGDTPANAQKQEADELHLAKIRSSVAQENDSTELESATIASNAESSAMEPHVSEEVEAVTDSVELAKSQETAEITMNAESSVEELEKPAENEPTIIPTHVLNTPMTPVEPEELEAVTITSNSVNSVEISETLETTVTVKEPEKSKQMKPTEMLTNDGNTATESVKSEMDAVMESPKVVSLVKKDCDADDGKNSTNYEEPRDAFKNLSDSTDINSSPSVSADLSTVTKEVVDVTQNIENKAMLKKAEESELNQTNAVEEVKFSEQEPDEATKNGENSKMAIEQFVHQTENMNEELRESDPCLTENIDLNGNNCAIAPNVENEKQSTCTPRESQVVNDTKARTDSNDGEELDAMTKAQDIKMSERMDTFNYLKSDSNVMVEKEELLVGMKTDNHEESIQESISEPGVQKSEQSIHAVNKSEHAGNNVSQIEIGAEIQLQNSKGSDNIQQAQKDKSECHTAVEANLPRTNSEQGVSRAEGDISSEKPIVSCIRGDETKLSLTSQDVDRGAIHQLKEHDFDHERKEIDLGTAHQPEIVSFEPQREEVITETVHQSKVEDSVLEHQEVDIETVHKSKVASSEPEFKEVSPGTVHQSEADGSEPERKAHIVTVDHSKVDGSEPERKVDIVSVHQSTADDSELERKVDIITVDHSKTDGSEPERKVDIGTVPTTDQSKEDNSEQKHQGLETEVAPEEKDVSGPASETALETNLRTVNNSISENISCDDDLKENNSDSNLENSASTPKEQSVNGGPELASNSDSQEPSAKAARDRQETPADAKTTEKLITEPNQAIESFEEPLSPTNSSASLMELEDFGGIGPKQSLPVSSDIRNWKVGYMQIKLPTKSRKAKLKAWQKRWVVVQADEFTSDSKSSNLVLSIYHSESGNSRRHSAAFWKIVSSKSAVLYRSMSRTHPYAFTVADGDEPLVHLSADSETATQEWMAAMRAILWPPSPVMQLEKVLNGNEFEMSIIDTDFSHRAGLLGTYGYMSVTTRKLILSHPQHGHVIQEWYLNTVDKFQILAQPKEKDTNKVLLMHTSKDSSTGHGELKLFCNEAVDFLKSLATTIHKVLQYHSKSRGDCYRKELDELADWLTPQPSPNISRAVDTEDYYKVPPRQVRSLLDIPNFIFDLPTKTVVVSEVIAARSAGSSPAASLKPSTTCVSTFSQDSGISMTTASDDALNSSRTSFSIGSHSLRRDGRCSSTSDSSDGYTPPASPDPQKRPSPSQGDDGTIPLQ